MTNLCPYGLTTRRCSSAVPWKTSRQLPEGSANRIISSTRRSASSAAVASLYGVPSKSRRFRISCRPSAFAHSQPASNSLSCSPGTTTSRAGKSSIRRYRAPSGAPLPSTMPRTFSPYSRQAAMSVASMRR
ncbi:Uncharacterised protein [Mycobacterium tuberculosis]|uniref:Uncharacterized protein n=1 Tax=Mycobacterium tuberculosis TaxID=1773 RepID=A0A0U0R6V5_MYCTX|nr:Uncharacterised protein [Mycobacterium tuberculosis]COV78001.1 Uncharacterised protein [Mycobacterium tuberculosis]COW59683.1 Uncharacterised protein [Mycobacterium tuberculosis]COX68924.1 Uncharacterised protein [Mycobacterium tuberculosis]